MASQWLKTVSDLAGRSGSAVPPVPDDLKLAATQVNPRYATSTNIMVSALMLAGILGVSYFARGSLSNIAVLIGIVVGAAVAASIGMMNFAHVDDAKWFAFATPLRFGVPIFDPVMIETMVLVLIVVMI